MVKAGEDPRFILRRLVILASEDVGLADPMALVVANAAAAAFERLGLPEGAYPLAEATLYLATAPKSNSAKAYFAALALVEQEGQTQVPAHLQDASRDGGGPRATGRTTATRTTSRATTWRSTTSPTRCAARASTSRGARGTRRRSPSDSSAGAGRWSRPPAPRRRRAMRGKLVACLIVPLLAVAFALGLGRIPGFDLLALKAGDVQRRLLADPERADRRMVLIEIDQASLDHFERDNIAYPWPRSLYNPLLEHCARGGAAAVIFDVLFNNLSPWGEETDADFAAGIRRNGRVFLAAAFSSAAAAGGPLDPRLSLAVDGTPPPELRRTSVSPPLPALRDAAAGIGSVTLRPDADGVVRRLPVGVLFGGVWFPASRSPRSSPGRRRRASSPGGSGSAG